MNEKLKKFYYSPNKVSKSKLIPFVFRIMRSIIEQNPISQPIYAIFVIFEAFQLMSITFVFNFSITTSNEESLEDTLRNSFKYIHYADFFSSANLTFGLYTIIVLINLFIELLSLIIFWILKVGKSKNLNMILSKAMGIYFFLEMYCLIPVNLSICLSVFYCNNGYLLNFPLQACNYQVTLIQMVNVLVLLMKIPTLYIVSFLFNDYSVFNKRLPWSCPYSIIQFTMTCLKTYLIFAIHFWKSTYVFNSIILYSFVLLTIYLRVQCPYYFHGKLNYLKIIGEGAYLSFMLFYPIFNISIISHTNYNIIFIFLFAICLGIFYLFLVIKMDAYLINSFHLKIDTFLLTGKINQYDLYIFLLRMCDVIKNSVSDQQNSNIIFSVYTQHRMICKELECSCKNVEDIIEHKKIQVKVKDANDEEANSIRENDIVEETYIGEPRYYQMDIRPQDIHLRIWGCFLEDVYDRLNIQSFVKVEFSNFLSFYLKKYIRSLIEISYVSSNNLSIPFQFIQYLSKEDLIHNNKKLFESDMDENFFNILEYNRYYEKFLNIIHKTSSMTTFFWTEMKNNIFKPKLIENKGYLICKNASKLEKYSKSILATNPTDIRTCKIYGAFLKNVLKLEDEGSAFIEKAYQQISMVSNIHIENAADTPEKKKRFSFLEEIESGVIVANGNKENIGRIEYVNYSFTTIFDYSKEEIIGKNLSVLMPNNLGKYHNQFILNFYHTSEPKFINKLRREIGLNKEKLIHPIKLVVKIFPCIDEGIFYIGLVRRTNFFNIAHGGSRHGNNLGYIMTNDEGSLLHYNKIVEERLKLSSNLVYDETKDPSEVFKIEMIFPELVNEEKMEEIKHDEGLLFYNTKAIEKMKKMQYSKVWESVKVSLNANQDCDAKQQTAELSSSSYASFLRKSISLNQKASLYRRSCLMVSKTDFIYISSIKFSIFQIVFEQGAEPSLLGLIKRYQEQMDEVAAKESNTNNNNNNDLTSMISKSSISMSNQTAAQKSSITFMLTHVKTATFQHTSPKILNIISLIILVKIIFVILYVFVQFSLIILTTEYVGNLYQLMNSLQNQKFALNSLKECLLFYEMIQTGVIEDTVNFNQTLSSVFYENSVKDFFLSVSNYNSEILKNSHFSKEIYALITKEDLQMSIFVDESFFLTKNYSITNALISLIDISQNLLDRFKKSPDLLDSTDIIADENGRFGLDNKPITIKRDVILAQKNLQYNYSMNVLKYYDSLFHSFISLCLISFEQLKFQLLIIFIVGLIVSILFLVLYLIAYIFFVNLRVNIIYLFSELSYDTVVNCLKNCEEFNSSIDKIIRDDTFFFETYYLADKTFNRGMTKIHLAFEDNQKNEREINLSSELDDINTIQQVFSKPTNNEAISVKKIIEEKKALNREEIDGIIGKAPGSGGINWNNNNNLNSSSSTNQNMNYNHSFTSSNSKKVNNPHTEGGLNRYRSPIAYSNVINPNSNADNILNDQVLELAVSAPYVKQRKTQKRKQLMKIYKFRKRKYVNRNIFVNTIVFLGFYVVCFFLSYIPFNGYSQIIDFFTCVTDYRQNMNMFVSSIRYNLINYTLNSYDTQNSFIRMYEYEKNLSTQIDLNMHKDFYSYQNFYQAHQTFNNEKPGEDACTYNNDYYVYGNSNYLEYCRKGFMRKGLQLGLSEAQAVGIKHINYLLHLNGINNIQMRKSELRNMTLNYLSEYSIFVFEPIMIKFINDYVTVATDSVNNMRSLHIINIVIALIVVPGILIVFFCKTRKRYLRRYIFNKAMVLMIPRNVFFHSSNYRTFQRLLQNT